MASELFIYGIVMSAATLGIYFLSLSLFADSTAATTMAFLTLGLTQLFHAFNVRSSKHSIIKGFLKNQWMHISFILSALLQIIVVLVRPLNSFFKVSQLTGDQWLYVCIASFAIIPICEIVKLLKKVFKLIKEK